MALGQQKRSAKLIILQRTIRKARGKHCARIRYEDDSGKTREILRSAESKSGAKMKLAELEVEILKQGTARLKQVRLRSGNLLNT
jgi:hypothetical protein